MRREIELRNAFRKMVSAPTARRDLIRAVLLIARTRYPQLDESKYLAYLEKLGDRLRSSIASDESIENSIEKLNQLLFREEGFRGNRDHYYDPDNCFLNRVISRRLGIPITLSLVYLEVARRAGLSLEGAAAPGHFMVMACNPERTIFVDPYYDGRLLSLTEYRKEIRERLRQSLRYEQAWEKPAAPAAILERLLRNLKAIYIAMNNPLKALEMIEWILVANPRAVRERRERGLIYESLGNIPRAVADLEAYLPHAVDDREARLLKRKLKVLKGTDSLRLH